MVVKRESLVMKRSSFLKLSLKMWNTSLLHCFIVRYGYFWWDKYRCFKKGLDSVFETGNNPIDNYQTKLVNATTDAANVNLGIYEGALTIMAEQRPWLVTIHCVNHHLQLAIKDAVSDINKFQECDKFYLNEYYLLSPT